MKEPKISVIVPVYKVEEYFERCVNSILKQTYKNLEIILVDDGSPDLCPAMCEEYAKKDSRVVVIHTENRGVSAARNVGLDNSTGEYILFVDSDDYIVEEACEILLENIIAHKADMVVFNHLFVNENYELLPEKEQKKYIEDKCLNRTQAWDELIKPHGGGYVAPWNKLYSRKIFNSLRFPIAKRHEDEYIIHHIINQCDKIICLSKPLYYYLQREDSFMAQSFNVINLDYGDALIDRYNLAKSIHHKELQRYCIIRLSFEMEKWKEYAEVDEKCRIKYNELRKKVRFLLCKKGAWYGYSTRGRFLMRLNLFFPSIGNVLKKLRS